MNSQTRTIIVAFIAVITIGIVLLLASSRPGQPPQALSAPSAGSDAPHPIQEKSEANVTVTVTAFSLTPASLPIFQIAFETHSVDLDFDVAEIVNLNDDLGNSYGNAQWQGSPPGGHHRGGTLTFERLLDPKATTMTLTLSNIAGVEARTFTWTIER